MPIVKPRGDGLPISNHMFDTLPRQPPIEIKGTRDWVVYSNGHYKVKLPEAEGYVKRSKATKKPVEKKKWGDIIIADYNMVLKYF